MRNESPPSSERASWLVCEREVSGQSTKIRFGSSRPGCETAVCRSIVICGSAPSEWAETVVDGANCAWRVLSKVTLGVPLAGRILKLEGVDTESYEAASSPPVGGLSEI